MASPAVIVTSPRLLLREMHEPDLALLAGMLADPTVMRHYPAPLTPDETRGWLLRQQTRYAAEGHGLWLAVRKNDLQPVGQVGLIRQVVDAVPELEVGYLLDRRFWGQGFATEAATAVLEHAFRAYRPDSLISLVRPENEPSRRVARRLGMTVSGHTAWHGLGHDVWRLARP